MDLFLDVMFWAIVIVAGLVVFGVAWWGLEITEVPDSPAEASSAPSRTPSPQRTAWVIYNPLKVGDEQQFRNLCTKFASLAKYDTCTFVTTSEHDPGIGQARAARSANATRVIAAGGDGTIRLVAGILDGSGIPLAILPVGTANLYARNINLPTDDLESAMRIAFSGTPRPMDLAWLTIMEDQEDALTPSPATPSTELQRPLYPESRSYSISGRHPFLVMAGVGFDAKMMADTSSDLKKQIGWGAYVAAGIKNAFGERLHVRVRLDDADHSSDIFLRTLLFANCGRLPGGLNLIPNAKPDDGQLDVLALDIRNGLLGWVNVFNRVIAQGIGFSRRDVKMDSASIKFRQAREATVQCLPAHDVQLDGDPVGKVKALKVELAHHALQVVAPKPTSNLNAQA
ncbi:diacylglycerol/lipid kinase family protein [Boudabousia marimammalium]|uniref:DAGKc domain-containing protein n=1 Tax=Boudabousia marimammalium TaxID=156892 RepID=A0A1Q5PKG9_9ACTO|nr:diacylglycerol kinase family protein [Boudabousia marimammalium]OKL46707.1 hypothetical protein BM477_07070 [Boudabousia marimammalium]